MSNFTIKFSNPWFLLLLIPALLFALLPYFRMNKRYRKTRNRITSIILHITVMVLSISVLAGATFEYDTPNKENELILLVDTSDSGEESMEDKNDFVKTIIDNTDSMFKLGIVTFGYDQVYAAELSSETEDMYAKYLQAPLPNNSATDVAAALNYAASLFTKKETARIVLLSDALETDGNAANAVKAIAAQGIKVDTVSYPNEEVDDEVQIVSMRIPDTKIALGVEFMVEVDLMSSYSGKAYITPTDTSATGSANGNPVEIDLIRGPQTVLVPYNFAIPGLHNLSIKLESDSDGSILNNIYTTYMTIQAFDKILIIESIDNESESLRMMLGEELKVNVVNVADPINMPDTVNEIRAYDQVILCNVSYSDMPIGFDELLYSYVYDFGGGLFTICGNEQDLNPNDEEWKANAYTRDDMFGTTYQKLLPVEIINYTPPAAVIIIIDRSGSMQQGQYEGSPLYYAKAGAEACLDALTERDYVGIMSLGTDSTEEIELTPRPHRAKIMSAIERIEVGGNTNFFPSFEQAGRILGSALETHRAEKAHIILVTDGQATDENDDYKKKIQENAEKGITLSIVGVNCNNESSKEMVSLLTNYAGMSADNFYSVADVSKLPEIMRKDLEVPEIKDVNYVTFKPTFGTTHIITSNIDEETMPTLDGFYGVKAKEGAEVVVMGQYTPIYAQWKCGKGTVGTFACDLNGTWSNEFVTSPVGATLINNIVQAVFPTQNVQPDEIDTVIAGENYSTVISIFTDLEEGEYINLTIKSPPASDAEEGEVQTITANAATGYSRLTFSVKTPGLHEITVEKMSEDGNLIASTTTYKAIGYSKEYDLFRDTEAANDLMVDMAETGNGVVVEDPMEVFDNVVKYIHNVINPKIAFVIISLVLFLLDIAARKFKWKWPHELIREKKAKARSQK